MIKRIAVHVDKDPACVRRVAAAMALAQAYDAQIAGIYAQDPAFFFGYDEARIPSSVLDVQRQRIAEEHDKCARLFRDWTAFADANVDWIAVEGAREDVLAAQARGSDILILTQADLETRQSSIEPYQLESVILTAGRPVITLPRNGHWSESIERVLVCWDGGRESARAVADAAPFLARAKEIVVLTIDKEADALPDSEVGTADLHAYLRAHGYVTATAASASSKGIGIGNAILNTAADYGSDLIVMGLYGHSRAREWILGGASRDMLSCMTVPVLFSH